MHNTRLTELNKGIFVILVNMNNLAHTSIYRNYDIRGRFPDEINEEIVELIGKALVDIYRPSSVLIGYDNRPSMTSLCDALTRGIISQGADVVLLGLVTTPMLYYASGSTHSEVAVMITASHMSSEYNGLKICIGDALPIGIDSGLDALKTYVERGVFKSVHQIGSISTLDIKTAWRQKLKSLAPLTALSEKKRIVIDPANAVGILEIDSFRQYTDLLDVHTIFDELDHSAPNHEANPLKYETLAALGEEVVRKQADFGVALDGDADRIGIVDEHGRPVPSDMIGIILAEGLLHIHDGHSVVHDIRSSKRAAEVIKISGGVSVPERVGHTYIRRTMRKNNSVFGFELSGHYFFRDMFFSEGGVLPALLLLEILHRKNMPLSKLVAEHAVYFHSGEINSEISKPVHTIYEQLLALYPEANSHSVDGLTMLMHDWWCNIRPSATDPVLRLNLEADTKELMLYHVNRILEVIRGA